MADAENVAELDVVTKLDLPVERILRKAQAANLQSVVVSGFNQDGTEYFASSYADGAEALWLLERSRHRLMHVVDRMIGDETDG